MMLLDRLHCLQFGVLCVCGLALLCGIGMRTLVFLDLTNSLYERAVMALELHKQIVSSVLFVAMLLHYSGDCCRETWVRSRSIVIAITFAHVIFLSAQVLAYYRLKQTNDSDDCPGCSYLECSMSAYVCDVVRAHHAVSLIAVVLVWVETVASRLVKRRLRMKQAGNIEAARVSGGPAVQMVPVHTAPFLAPGPVVPPNRNT